jgi:hypothetical protein
MPTDDPDFSPELARALIEAARRIERLKPWDWTGGKLLFALEDTATGWPVAVSIPGEREEVLGVSFYLGVLGIDFLVRLANDFFGEDEGRDAMMRLHVSMLEFEEPRFLEPEDRTLLEVAGEAVGPGGVNCPVFRCAAPGELPWLCETEDARTILRWLTTCADALEAAEAAPQMIAWDYLNLPTEEDDDIFKTLEEEITTDKVIDYMHENALELDLAVGRSLDEQKVENFPVWRVENGRGSFRRETFEVREAPAPKMVFEDLTKATLRRLMEEPGRGTWEVGRRLGVPVGQPGSRYFHTEILALRDTSDGRVLAAEVGKVVERPRLLGRMLRRTIYDEDTLPAKLRCDDEELLVLLDGFGLEFGVAVEGDECPELDQTLDELVQRMLGS